MFILQGVWVETAQQFEERCTVFWMEVALSGGVKYPPEIGPDTKIPGCDRCPLGGFCANCYRMWKGKYWCECEELKR
jgi:hypothetical protein